MLTGCVAFDPPEPQAFELNADMKPGEVIEQAISRGGAALAETKTFIHRRHMCPSYERVLSEEIESQTLKWPSMHLINALNLYQFCGSAKAPEMFVYLTHSGRTLAQQLGWRLAAVLNSEAMAMAVDTRLTKAINDGDLQDMYWPELADAIANNGLKSSVSILAQGLYSTGHISFVRAYSKLSPQAASEAFMVYLAKASLEELRQLAMTRVDTFTCTEIMQHLMQYPPSLGNPDIDSLIYFSIARNQSLAEMAHHVLARYLPQNASVIASLIVRQPLWVQLGFLERSKTYQFSATTSLYSQLRDQASQKEVLDEIQYLIQ